MAFFEETKKYTFNNEQGKSEIMKIQFSKKQTNLEEMPTVRTNRGKIGYTNKYKYLADKYDQTGRNISKIERKWRT